MKLVILISLLCLLYACNTLVQQENNMVVDTDGIAIKEFSEEVVSNNFHMIKSDLAILHEGLLAGDFVVVPVDCIKIENGDAIVFSLKIQGESVGQFLITTAMVVFEESVNVVYCDFVTNFLFVMPEDGGLLEYKVDERGRLFVSSQDKQKELIVGLKTK